MTQESRKYALKEGLITGGCTFVLCVIIFIFLNKTDMDIPEIAADLVGPVAVTTMICTAIQIPLKKKAAEKSEVPDMGELDGQYAFFLTRKNYYFMVFGLALRAFWLFACAPVGLMVLVAPDLVIRRFAFICLKSILVALSAGMGVYTATILVVSRTRREKGTAV